VINTVFLASASARYIASYPLTFRSSAIASASAASSSQAVDSIGRSATYSSAAPTSSALSRPARTYWTSAFVTSA
jgi:hypothetical protein